MKRLFLILFLIYFDTAYSQNISIELSIKWIMESDKMGGVLKENIPYLIISYRNNSDSNFYFLKVSLSKNGLPPVNTFGSWNHLSSNPKTLSKSNYKYCGKDKNYNVYMSSSQYCSSFWEVLKDDVNFYKGHFGDIINEELFEFYDSMQFQFKKDTINDSMSNCQFKNNLKIENTINCPVNNFVFLQAGTSYSEQINLIGFKKLQGNFKFYFMDSIFSNYVYGQSFWNDKLKRLEQTKIELPQKIKEYNLYSGPFRTNSVDIKF
jgi:hypothetical protein